MYALIARACVVQLSEQPFEVAPTLTWVDLTSVSPQPNVGWTYVSGVWTAPPTPVAAPDSGGLLEAVKTLLGQGGVRALLKKYPDAIYAIQAANWPWVQQAILDARAANDLSAAQYAQLQQAVATYRIPITLP